MNRLARISACVAAGTLACSALAQPTMTSLGTGTPLSVTNDLSGTYYIGGAGMGGTASPGRWTLTGGILSTSVATGTSGGGNISKDNGDYLTSLVVNGPTRWAVGNATPTNAVSPPFNAPTYAVPASLVANAASPAATEFGGARWSFPGASHTLMGTVPIIPFTPNPAATAVTTISCGAGVATCTSVAHGLVVGDRVYVIGNSIPAYNGVFTVASVIDADNFTYAATCGLAGSGGTARKFDVGNSGVFGTSSGGQSTSSFLSPHGISANGRFIVGQNYVCVYNAGATAGTSISANSFYWRPVLWDAQGNAGAGSLVVLPTPFRTSTSAGANTRRRTGNAYAVSNDGLVIAGATEHNTAVTPGPDVDGGRLVVWRWNAGTSSFDMTYLDTGTDVNGFPGYISSTPSNLAMNSAGTIIAARGPAGITKWNWDGSSWGSPIVLGSNLGVTTPISTVSCSGGIVTVITSAPHGLAVNANINISGNLPSGTLPFGATGFNGYFTVTSVPNANTFEYMVTSCPNDTNSAPITGTGGNVNAAASWIPASVRTCGQPPTALGNSICMSDDGNTIGGSATYTTCGSFVAGGFIWHASDNLIKDWYDYNVSLGTPGCSTGGFFGPIGDNGDPSRGQAVAGNPLGISPDGTVIVGRHSSNQMIIGAAPWIWQATGGASCVAPVITSNPTPSVNFSRCSVSPTVNLVILNASAAGTAPLNYQWYRGATPLADGPTGTGSSITGATSFQLRIALPGAADVGSYSCIVTGCNGLTATTTSSTVAADPAMITPANDLCSGAITIGEGLTNFNICGAYVNDGASTCLPPGVSEVADLWFNYVPTFTGNARFQTCASAFDTTLQAYDGSGGCGGGVIACNDDVGTRGLAGVGTCQSTRSLLSSVPVTMGVPVLVRVGALGTPTSNSNTTGALTISQAPAAPANDLCDNATNVTVNSTTPFDLSEATDDYNFGIANMCSLCPNDSATASNRDVWFRLVSPCGGTYTISTCGSTISNPIIHVFQDDCLNGELLRCSDNVGSGVSGCTSNQAGIGLGTCGTNGTPLTITGSVLIRVAYGSNNSPGTAANAGQGVLVISGTDVVCRACCDASNNCTMVAPANCTGTLKDPSAVCTPDTCVSGACCCGSSCSIISAGNCVGANSAFVPGGVCTPYSTTVPCCRGNFNKSEPGPGAPGGISVQDIFDFLNSYFSNDPCANANDSIGANNGISVQDIFDFLAAYFGGC